MRTPVEILAETKTIALVGASPRPERPSNSVMRYLLAQGYRVIPVRPHRTEILGIPCVDSVTDIEEPVDLVDVFRRAEFCPEVAEQAVAAGAKALWLQLGIVSRRRGRSPSAPGWTTSRTRAPRSCTASRL